MEKILNITITMQNSYKVVFSKRKKTLWMHDQQTWQPAVGEPQQPGEEARSGDRHSPGLCGLLCRPQRPRASEGWVWLPGRLYNLHKENQRNQAGGGGQACMFVPYPHQVSYLPGRVLVTHPSARGGASDHCRKGGFTLHNDCFAATQVVCLHNSRYPTVFPTQETAAPMGQ